MKNIYSDFNSTFCLLQQITLDKNEKYFIFGIKFDCKLFENVFVFILSYKKLIFFQTIMDYISLKKIEKIKKFNELNKENVSLKHLFYYLL